MAVVDLLNRCSDNNAVCEKSKLSPESLIYISPKPLSEHLSPISCDLTIGAECYRPNVGKKYTLDENGIKVKPGVSVVVYTKEHIRTPFNVFGLVTGKGKYIYQGCMVASGKIDPGFDGHLKICFYNGGKSSVILKPNEPFCTVFFIDTAYTLSAPLYASMERTQPMDTAVGKWRAFRIWVKKNWLSLISLPVSIWWFMQLIDKIKEFVIKVI